MKSRKHPTLENIKKYKTFKTQILLGRDRLNEIIKKNNSK